MSSGYPERSFLALAQRLLLRREARSSVLTQPEYSSAYPNISINSLAEPQGPLRQQSPSLLGRPDPIFEP
jgi:hypothetical protein